MFTWRIHTGLIDGREAELASLLSANGDCAQLVTGRLRELPAPTPVDDAERGGIALTTLQDAAALLDAGWAAPRLLYFDKRKYDVSYWLPRVRPSIPVLNRGCLFTPAGLIGAISLPLWASPFPRSHGLLFIRPDSGLKPFPGLVIDCHKERLRNWDEVADVFAREVPMLAPEKLTCIAPGYRLNPVEWRFWVVDREVVASSPYSWDEGAVPWQAPPAEALSLALEMAQNPWQPDIAYVVDIVQLADGDEPFCLNELNAASTSGLYSVPFEPLLTALRTAVLRELDGELSVED